MRKEKKTKKGLLGDVVDVSVESDLVICTKNEKKYPRASYFPILFPFLPGRKQAIKLLGEGDGCKNRKNFQKGK